MLLLTMMCLLILYCFLFCQENGAGAGAGAGSIVGAGAGTGAGTGAGAGIVDDHSMFTRQFPVSVPILAFKPVRNQRAIPKVQLKRCMSKTSKN